PVTAQHLHYLALHLHATSYIVFLTSRFLTFLFLFFFNDTATTEIYTLSLHDALPILSGPHVPAHGAHCEHVRDQHRPHAERAQQDRKSTRLNSSHVSISYAVFCLKKKKRPQVSPVRDPDQGLRESAHGLPRRTVHVAEDRVDPACPIDVVRPAARSHGP